MRNVFFLIVLAAYVTLVPTGSPNPDLGDPDAIALDSRARELQKAWVENGGAGLLDLATDENRGRVLEALVDMADREVKAGEGTGLSDAQKAQVSDLRGRVRALALSAPAAQAGEAVRLHRSSQASLCAEIVAWLRANGRLPERVHRILRNVPRIVRFDHARGAVQFCSHNRAEANLDPLVTFDRIGGRWFYGFELK